MQAWVTPGGLVFSQAAGERLGTVPISVPCRGCIACRITIQAEKAIRAEHERQMYDEAGHPSSFITLTYDDANLPFHGLKKADAQAVVRKIQKWSRLENHGHKLRYLIAGEYGDKFGRAHYHLVLFGTSFRQDRVPHYKSNGRQYYTSETLTRLWGKGHADLCDLDHNRCQYAVKYALEEVKGKAAPAHYSFQTKTGSHQRAREFVCASNRPGLGYSWFVKYRADIFPRDELIHNGKRLPVPGYYFKLLERLHPDLYLEVKAKRVSYGEANDPRNDPEQHPKRRTARFNVHSARANRRKADSRQNRSAK